MSKKKKQALTTRRNVSTAKIEKLTKKALKNKPQFPPPKGYKHLKDLSVGSLFETSSGIRGVLIYCEINAKVVITDVKNICDEDKNYYLGKQTISAHTEVKEVVN